MKLRILFLGLYLLPYGIPAQSAPAKQLPPKPQPSRPFQLKQRTRYTLPNGLQVSLLQYGTVPKAFILVRVGAGSVNLDASHTGFPSLVASLMAEGTTSRTGPEIARAAADMGGSLAASAGSYETTFALDVLSESAPGAISLLGDVIQHPAFPEKDFARLQNDALRRIAVSLANPRFLASQKYAQLMYGDQPYGRLLPTEAMVKAYRLDDVRKYYESNFGAARTRVYVVGQFDERAVRSAIQTAFASWRKGPVPAKPVQHVTGGVKFAMVPQPGATQSNVIYGTSAPDLSSPDSTPFLVMDSLLGGSFGSRITANIRENKGYTYSPYSSVENNYKLSTWQEGAAITSASTGPALREIDNEIKKLQATPPPPEELAAIQRFTDGSFVRSNSTRRSIANQLSMLDFNELTDDYLVNYTKRVDAVTSAQVQSMVNKYLKLDTMTLVVVGDPAVIGPQLSDRQK